VNGVHDMGGMQGLGSLDPEPGEPVFHEGWEARVLALVIASPVRGNIDAGRHRRELIPGPAYLGMRYYERWFAGLCGMLLEAGIVSGEELATGAANPDVPKATPRLRPETVAPALSSSGSYRREIAAPPAFRPGEGVRARNLNPLGHTRLPRYVRGREGVVERWHGAHVFPDVHAHGGAEDPQHLYSVRFTARELWGPGASERDTVRLDLWEPYLERP
jgi:nitrile hydratase